MFFPSDQYQLLDFGEGRCLERFGSYVLNRRYPSVDGTRKGNVELWKDVDAIFIIDKADRRVNPVGRGTWKPVLLPLPESWTITSGQLVFELKFTPFGHIGIFPEHAANWETITNLLTLRSGAKVLNLFGYTGAATLVAAAAGAEVTHVDAARNIVEWAKKNASLSELPDTRIRWIVDDVVKFVRRSIRRGCHYDAIILDPPTYGHGTNGEVWQLTKHLPMLLRDCFALLSDNPIFIMLTAHTQGYDSMRLANMLRGASQGSVSEYNIEEPTGKIRGFRMALQTTTGKRMSAGCGATFVDAAIK